jgi:uncharacterized membrane protein YhaH (DUF805 family)
MWRVRLIVDDLAESEALGWRGRTPRTVWVFAVSIRLLLLVICIIAAWLIQDVFGMWPFLDQFGWLIAIAMGLSLIPPAIRRGHDLGVSPRVTVLVLLLPVIPYAVFALAFAIGLDWANAQYAWLAPLYVSALLLVLPTLLLLSFTLFPSNRGRNKYGPKPYI